MSPAHWRCPPHRGSMCRQRRWRGRFLSRGRLRDDERFEHGGDPVMWKTTSSPAGGPAAIRRRAATTAADARRRTSRRFTAARRARRSPVVRAPANGRTRRPRSPGASRDAQKASATKRGQKRTSSAPWMASAIRCVSRARRIRRRTCPQIAQQLRRHSGRDAHCRERPAQARRRARRCSARSRASARSTSRHMMLPEPSQIELSGVCR